MARLRAGQKLALAWFFGNRESRKFIGGGGGATLEIKQSIQSHPLAQGPEPVNWQNALYFSGHFLMNGSDFQNSKPETPESKPEMNSQPPNQKPEPQTLNQKLRNPEPQP